MNTFDVYNASAGKLQASFRVCGSSNTAVWIETDGAKLRLIKGLGYVEADGQGHYRK